MEVGIQGRWDGERKERLKKKKEKKICKKQNKWLFVGVWQVGAGQTWSSCRLVYQWLSIHGGMDGANRKDQRWHMGIGRREK